MQNDGRALQRALDAPLDLNSARGYHARDARSVVDSDGLAVHVTLNLTSDQ